MTKTAIIVDIDGTLADTARFAGKWADGVRDGTFAVRDSVAATVRAMAAVSIVIICTARTVDMMDATIAWLAANDIPCDILRMQTTWGDVSEYKASVVEEATLAGLAITHSFDDDDANNEMFADFGFIEVVQV